MKQRGDLTLSKEKIAYLKGNPVVSNNGDLTVEEKWLESAKLNASSFAEMTQGAVEALMTGYDQNK